MGDVVSESEFPPLEKPCAECRYDDKGMRIYNCTECKGGMVLTEFGRAVLGLVKDRAWFDADFDMR